MLGRCGMRIWNQDDGLSPRLEPSCGNTWREQRLQAEVVEPQVALEPMSAGREVVKDYRSQGLGIVLMTWCRTPSCGLGTSATPSRRARTCKLGCSRSCGWLFTILRNAFYSEHRKRVREVEDADGDYTARLMTVPDQVSRLEMRDLQKALQRLRPDQREALLLVAAEGDVRRGCSDGVRCGGGHHQEPGEPGSDPACGAAGLLGPGVRGRSRARLSPQSRWLRAT
jgi:hypothetical protein